MKREISTQINPMLNTDMIPCLFFCFKRSLKQAVYVAYFDNSSVTGWTRASMQRRL